MTQWTPKVEKLVREAGETIEKNMKKIVDPKRGVTRTALSSIFGGYAVNRALKKACKESGVTYKKNWVADERTLISLAAQNKSNAADKIKTWAPVAEDIANQYKPSIPSILKQVKFAKKKYGQ